MMRFRMLVISAAFSFAALGCSPQFAYHGYPRTSIDSWAHLHAGESKAEIIGLLGEPMLVSRASDNVWYYFSFINIDKDRFAARKYSSRTLRLTFDKNNRLIVADVVLVPDRAAFKFYGDTSIDFGINPGFYRRYVLGIF